MKGIFVNIVLNISVDSEKQYLKKMKDNKDKVVSAHYSLFAVIDVSNQIISKGYL